jgi:hypothetical protein
VTLFFIFFYIFFFLGFPFCNQLHFERKEGEWKKQRAQWRGPMEETEAKRGWENYLGDKAGNVLRTYIVVADVATPQHPNEKSLNLVSWMSGATGNLQEGVG